MCCRHILIAVPNLNPSPMCCRHILIAVPNLNPSPHVLQTYFDCCSESNPLPHVLQTYFDCCSESNPLRQCVVDVFNCCSESDPSPHVLQTYFNCKLLAVITSLDSTLYHCHQQGFSPKYRRIVFFNYINFWTYLLKIQYLFFKNIK